MIKGCPFFSIFDDGQTHDGGGAIFYLDFTQSVVYKTDYHNIGFKENGIMFDGDVIVALWKNLSPWQQTDLENRLSTAHQNAVYSSTNTWGGVTQKVIYEYIKSLSGANGLKTTLAEREMYVVLSDNTSNWSIETLNFNFDFSQVTFSATDSQGNTQSQTLDIVAYDGNSFTLNDSTKFTIVEVHSDYILVNAYGVERRVYFNKQKAQVYIDTL